MSYQRTIESLLSLLREANTADHENAMNWQVEHDASQSSYYGYLYNAIKSIAGESILDHHSKTGEANIQLANRLPIACSNPADVAIDRLREISGELHSIKREVRELTDDLVLDAEYGAAIDRSKAVAEDYKELTSLLDKAAGRAVNMAHSANIAKLNA